MEQINPTVWLISGALLVVMVAITSVALRLQRGPSRKMAVMFGAWVLACFASGLVVRALVGWQLNTTSLHVVPGPVPTWLPAIAAVTLAAVAVSRKARQIRSQ